MENLPERIFKSGEEPDGDRVHKYFQLQYLNDLSEHLEADEISKIRGSWLGKLFDIRKKFSFSNKLCLFLLTRQLAIQKKHEIWFVFAGKPIRFGLREFASVTGLRCDPISIGKADGKKKVVSKNKIKKKSTEAPYWYTLFARNEEVTPEILIKRLKSGVVRDPDIRLKYALLVLIDGVLCPRSLNMKIQEETVEVLRDVDKFFNHPWGRISFDMTMSCIKSRKASGLAQTTFSVQGFVHALQLVLLEAVPDIEKSMPVDTPVFVGEDYEEEAVVVGAVALAKLKLEPIWVIDSQAEASVESIIPLDDAVVGDDLSWSDEVEDVKIDNLVRLVQEGYQWSGDEFGGGVVVSALPVEPKEKAEGKKVVKSRKRKKPPVCGSSSDGSQPVPFSESQIEWLAKQISSQVSLAVSSMEDRLVSRLKGKSGAGPVGGKIAAAGAVSPVAKGKVKPSSRGKKAVLPKRKRMRVDGRLREIRDDDETETATVPVGDESETVGGKGGDEGGEDVRMGTQEGEASVTMEDVETEERGGKGGDDVRTARQQGDAEEHVDVHPDDTVKAVLDSLNLPSEVEVSENLAPDPQQEDVAVLSGDDCNDQQAAAKSGDGFNDQDGADKSGDGLNDQDAAAKSGDGLNDQDAAAKSGDGINDQDAAAKSVNDIAECQGKESSEAGTLALFPSGASVGLEENVSGEGDAIDKKWLEIEKFLADGGKYLFGGSLFLLTKDVEEIVGLQVVWKPWMMDAFIKYFRDKWATLEVGLNQPKVVFQGTKFASHILGHRIKFEKSVKKKYVFDPDLMACVPPDFDTLYFPFNFDKQHWVGMCLDIRGRYLYVFDCNQKVRRDTRLRKEMEPLLEMLLFVVRQASPELMKAVPTDPFILSRDTHLPTCLHPSESGLMSLLFIERHAVGGIEAARGVRPEELAVQAKQLLIEMYDVYAEK
ncbi:Papain-like cysteine peptidase superfamily [Arabidopsis thaliana x Arabidopsis arenosa]|uniref:Papain-like cysteine peptidase superfamily n=1 Tax=Arabidopsis thaliana x Arabidopsis arenosa TaxID=1240361 RepID=A0A8T2C8K6_9BRAS|nr:Papain-like cysteine peptidase superfamily [Arabidopsis thaliana x Arabidopsis arenosa]